jgi:hypothetical protein
MGGGLAVGRFVALPTTQRWSCPAADRCVHNDADKKRWRWFAIRPAAGGGKLMGLALPRISWDAGLRAQPGAMSTRSRTRRGRGLHLWS